MKKSKFILGILSLFFIVGFSDKSNNKQFLMPQVEVIMQYKIQYTEQEKAVIRSNFATHLGPISVGQMSNHSNGNEQEVWTVNFVIEQHFNSVYNQVIMDSIGTTLGDLDPNGDDVGDPGNRYRIVYTYLGMKFE